MSLFLFFVVFIMNLLEECCGFYYFELFMKSPQLCVFAEGVSKLSCKRSYEKCLRRPSWCFDKCARKWPMRNTSYSVHSYSIWYLAHDPSAKHNDLYHTDEQLLTPCFRIYALCFAPQKSGVYVSSYFTSFYLFLWVLSLRYCKTGRHFFVWKA